MKIISFLIFLQVNVGFSQSYDSLIVFNVSEKLKDLEIDENNGLVYISNDQGVKVYNIDKKELSAFDIRDKELPEFPYHAIDKSKETPPSLDPVLLRKSHFTHNGDYFIYYYLKNQYEHIYVYKRHKKRYKLYSKFNNEAHVYSIATNSNLIMAVGGPYGQLRLWDLKRKKFIRLMKPNISTGVITSIRFSQVNQDKIIISNGACQCVILDTKTDQVHNTWRYGFIDVPGTTSRVGQGAMEMNFANGDSLAIISLTNRLHNSLNLWTTNSNKVYQESIDSIQPVSYDLVDNTLFIVDSTGTISEYNINQRKISSTFHAKQSDLNLLKLSEHGKYMVTANGKGEVKIWLKNEYTTKPKRH